MMTPLQIALIEKLGADGVASWGPYPVPTETAPQTVAAHRDLKRAARPNPMLELLALPHTIQVHQVWFKNVSTCQPLKQ